MNVKKSIIYAVICCLLISIPFFAVKFPPFTDLPQHIGQVRILQEVISSSDSPYRIQWMTPYSLVYGLLSACWFVVGPEHTGRIGMLIITLFWVIMIHFLTAKRKRPALGAVLAAVLFFCHIMYWGFYQFALGWVVFIGWLLLIKDSKLNGWRESFIFFGGAIILYYAHVLWFLIAMGWLFIGDLIFRHNLKRILFRTAGIVPVLVLVALWYPSLSAYGFGSRTIWTTLPFERFSFSWFVDAALGGLSGSIEYIIFGFLILWIVLACLQNRRELRIRVDLELLLLASVFLFLGLILPDKHVNTIRFAQRWIPPALSFLLISIPIPRIKQWIAGLAVGVILVGFICNTALSWIAFERVELAGLKQSLKALPEKPRVIGLSYIKQSSIVRGSPFVQVFAYSQVYKGGELNFSFADFGPSFAVYKKRRQKPWTRGLEWFPEWVRMSDFRYFDYAIINATEEIHTQIIKVPILIPATVQGKWRLYKVSKGSFGKDSTN